MTKNSFFTKAEWNTRDCGFYGEFHADKLYAIEYDNVKEKLVNDVLQVMKDRADCMVTFECFTGYESISLLRIFCDADGMTMVCWENGSAEKTEHIPVNKRNIRKAVNLAIEKFFAKES